jgi:hypothetical protein
MYWYFCLYNYHKWKETRVRLGLCWNQWKPTQHRFEVLSINHLSACIRFMRIRCVGNPDQDPVRTRPFCWIRIQNFPLSDSDSWFIIDMSVIKSIFNQPNHFYRRNTLCICNLLIQNYVQKLVYSIKSGSGSKDVHLKRSDSDPIWSK